MTGNCNDALRELYEFLDGELTDERKALIKDHLAGCNPCLEAFDFEAEVRILVSTKCREEAPDTLRQRVIDALRDCDPATEPATESDA
jgi:mycothiol system anti-sigma-R factor